MRLIKGFLRCALLTLFLVNNAHAIVPTDFINKDWILRTLNGIRISLQTYPGKKPRLKFHDDLRFAAWAGCNEISGNYYFKEPDTLRFDENMIMTRMACEWPQNVEDELIKALQAVQKVSITADLMQLINAENKVLVEYVLLQP